MTSMPTLSLVMPGSRWHGRNAADGVPLEALGESELFGVIDEAAHPLLDTAIAHHCSSSKRDRLITLIVPAAAPPLSARRLEPEIFSFLASPDIARELVASGQRADLWCYVAMSSAIKGAKASAQFQIVHRADPPVLHTGIGTCEAILCHRGAERHLRLCVDSLLHQTMPVTISVGIDQKYPCTRFLADIADEPQVHAYQIDPHPVGPYAAFHIFGSRSQAHYIARQDTDDLALPERFANLTHALASAHAGMAGSHDIQVNEISQKIEAIRYPLDVNDALRKEGALNHQIMPRNSVCTREAFAAVGGYSTQRIFGHGVDFWLRAAMHAPVINVDEFLYIRRRHAGSLTTRGDIGIGSEPRRKVQQQRSLDLALILAGDIKAEDTSLGVHHRAGNLQFRDLRTNACEQIAPATIVPR